MSQAPVYVLATFYGCLSDSFGSEISIAQPFYQNLTLWTLADTSNQFTDVRTVTIEQSLASVATRRI